MPTTAPAYSSAQQNWASYTMSGSAQPGFWSRSGDSFQRDVLLKKQCLCLGNRAKCCLLPDAFLEHRGGSAAARHSWSSCDRMGVQHSKEMTKLIQGWEHDAIFCPWQKRIQFPSALACTCSKLQHSCFCEWHHAFLLDLIDQEESEGNKEFGK